MHTRHRIPFMWVVPSGLVYFALFSPNALVISRMCAILVNYRREIDALRSSADCTYLRLPHGNGLAEVPRLNEFIWNYCTCLWLDQALQAGECAYRLDFPEFVLRHATPTSSSSSFSQTPQFSSKSSPSLLFQVSPIFSSSLSLSLPPSFSLWNSLQLSYTTTIRSFFP
jgi:hypothetical protein